MRLLLLLLIAGVVAYFTVPTRTAHEDAARAYLQGREPGESSGSFSLESVVGYVKGMMAGEGRYENFSLLSKYSVDLPGADYLECYGAFTIVHCAVVEPGQG